MTEIYWITRLDGINLFFCILMIFSLIGIIGLTTIIFLDGRPPEEMFKKFAKYIKIVTISFVIGILGVTFIPTTNDVMLMYGLGTIKEYVDNNEKTKELPDKAIDALNKYLDKINDNKEK